MDKYNKKSRGRPRKYKTPGQLRRAIEGYFGDISAVMTVTDELGKVVKNVNGEEITRLVYLVPPSIQSLCLHLGITERTWSNYSDDPMLEEICEDAKLRVKAYLMEQLNLRERPQGIIFNLQNNYEMREKRETGVSIQHSMSLAEMKQLIMSESEEMREDDAED